MWGITPKLLTIALLPLVAAGTFVGVFFFFYQGSYDPPPSVDVPYEQIETSSVSEAAPQDSGTTRGREGLLVIDAAHGNSFTEGQIATLTSWVAARGYDVEFLGNFLGIQAARRVQLLEEKLREADSFLLMLPLVTYLEQEIDLLERFVEKGGKLVLVSDPTRPNRINLAAKRFGVEFQPDYLYNTVEYDLNFRHIFVRDFQPSALTSGLDTIVLYIAGSVRSSGEGVAFTDANTESSLGETAEVHKPIALGNSRNVLALADITFLIPPYNALLDNDRFLSNLGRLPDRQSTGICPKRLPTLLRRRSRRGCRHIARELISLGYRAGDEKRAIVVWNIFQYRRSGRREPGYGLPWPISRLTHGQPVSASGRDKY